MADVRIVSDSEMELQKDFQVWTFGENTIIFDEAFCDSDYVFHAEAANVEITEVRGSRTPISVKINVSADTDEGWYVVSGCSNDFNDSGVLGGTNLGANGKIVRGTKVLIQGTNTINFGISFTDTNYTFLNTVARDGTIINILVKSLDHITVDSPGACTLDFIAVGD